MKKIKLIAALSEKTGLLKKDVKSVLESLVEVTQDKLNTDKVFTIAGLVKFKVVHREARMGRNPATGLQSEFPAKNVVKAKALHPVSKA